MGAKLRRLRGGRNAERCGLCGRTKDLTRTDCCGNWICDDEHTYVMFSFARNSCHRNHRRHTLCAYHHSEEHEGDWRDCAACRAAFEPELVTYYGTNEYNFVKLPDPPEFEPKRCADCDDELSLGLGGYSISPGGTYRCTDCAEARWEREP